MLDCPDCGGSYRVVTSSPASNTIREYYCECKVCGIRFLQYAVLESFIFENSKSKPPSKQLQPHIAKKRDVMLRLISPKQKCERPAMRFL
ncbi:ogr/Delta-like zinc finger family protein [Moritella viscosa]|uniref:ogr/Delta-like zinc finger family protein n=1 Tax=Moritella viscosa TaxID=80854 RepID=UPI00094D4A6E